MLFLFLTVEKAPLPTPMPRAISLDEGHPLGLRSESILRTVGRQMLGVRSRKICSCFEDLGTDETFVVMNLFTWALFRSLLRKAASHSRFVALWSNARLILLLPVRLLDLDVDRHKRPAAGA